MIYQRRSFQEISRATNEWSKGLYIHFYTVLILRAVEEYKFNDKSDASDECDSIKI
jgi:hypothetical protein